VYHGLAVAICLIAALALIAGAIRGLFATCMPRAASAMPSSTRSSNTSVRVAWRPILCLVPSNSSIAAQEGWSLLDRTLQAKRAVRLAVR